MMRLAAHLVVSRGQKGYDTVAIAFEKDGGLGTRQLYLQRVGL
jgi:hypothetical protein